MVIQPFNYQKRTNIEEHNQIVDKLNEVVDAVNIIDPSGQGLEPRVTALETDVTDLGVRVDSVESKNLQQDTAITDIRADAETTKNRLGTVEGNLTTVTGRVTQLETDTTALDGRVTDIDGRLTTLAGNYTTLGGRVDTLNTEVGQLTTKTTSLETGKVNVAQGTENAGKILGIGADGNIEPQLLNHPFKVEYNSELQITSTEAYGDNLFAGIMALQMTLSDQYDYIFKVELTGNDTDIDWYPTQEQGYFNIIFDRQPTNTVKVRIFGVVIG